MNAKTIAKQVSFFKESLYEVGATFAAGLPEGWDEAYLAYFVSADGNKDNLLAAARMQNSDKVLNLGTPDTWTLEYF